MRRIGRTRFAGVCFENHAISLQPCDISAFFARKCLVLGLFNEIAFVLRDRDAM
jgi:hypothetical protein